MNSTYSLIDVIQVILSNWKKIALMAILGAIVGIIVGLLIPNYYKASTTFYPASQDLSKFHKIFGGDKNIDYYGNRQDLDRLLTIGGSSKLKIDLIDKFDLFNRYNIDSSSKNALHTVFLKLDNLYNLKRTERDAIELSIEDEDPFVSADMANYARRKIGSLSTDVIKLSQKSNIDKLSQTISEDQKFVTILRDSLSYLRKKYNIYNNDAQSEHLSEFIGTAQSSLAENRAKLKYYRNHPVQRADSIMILEARVAGYVEKVKSLTQSSGGYFNLQSFREGLPQFEQISDMYSKELSQLNYSRLLLNQMKLVYMSDFFTIQLIEEATVPIIKSRPHRSQIVLGAALLAAFLSILGIVCNEYWRKSK